MLQHRSTLMLHPEPEYDHRVCAEIHPELGLHSLAAGHDCTGGGFLWTPGSFPALVALRSLEEAMRAPGWGLPAPNPDTPESLRQLERGLEHANRRLCHLARHVDTLQRPPLTYRPHDTWQASLYHKAATGQALGVLVRDDQLFWSCVGELRLHRWRDGQLTELTRQNVPPEYQAIFEMYPSISLNNLGTSHADPISGHDSLHPGDRYLMTTYRLFEALPEDALSELLDIPEQARAAEAMLDRVVAFREACGLILIDVEV